MNQTNLLPDDVIEAIRYGRKIEAIKRLRGHYKLGLKEAKTIVDDYISENGEQMLPDTAPNSGKLERFVLLLIIAAILYGVYDYLMK